MDNYLPNFQSIFDLDIIHGELYWKKRLAQRVHIRNKAGYETNGYKTVTVKGFHWGPKKGKTLLDRLDQQKGLNSPSSLF